MKARIQTGLACALLAVFLTAIADGADAPAKPVATQATSTGLPAKFNDATPLDWSIKMAKSEMNRTPARPRWDYTTALLSLSMMKLSERTGDQAYTAYADGLIGSCVQADGTITGYRAQEYTLDNIASGKTLLYLYEKNKEPRLLTAIQTLRQQLKDQPRTASGGFWHKQTYPNQMWLDGIFMASPFYAQYGKMFNEPADFDDTAKQILLIGEHTYDPKTGLFYHAWDESKQLFWANKDTGQSPNFWGRALGWYAMGIVDSLTFMPDNQPQRAKIIELLGRVADGIVKWQDPKTGLWWQVLDQGNREGNYLEATAACQFIAAIAKAVNEGYLPRAKYIDMLNKGYAGIVRDLITANPDGTINLIQCCSVAGLGPDSNRRRDGTFAYYISEPVVSNDLKGVGPFILAGMEMQKLEGGSSTATSSTSSAPSAASTSSSSTKTQ